MSSSRATEPIPESDYYAYERFSRIDDESMAIERQQADNAEKAERLGWAPKLIHLQEQASAWKKRGARPKFNHLVAAIREGRCKGAIVWNLDRLLRRTDELEELISAVEAAPKGFMLTTASGDLDLATPEGRFAARILVAVAQKESDDKSRRVKRALRDKDLRGAMYGETPEQAVVLQEIIRRIFLGESALKIARDLTARKIPTSRSGETWHSSAIRRTLRNPRLMSDGVLTAEEFGKLQLILGTGPVREARREFLLTGLLECGRCGRPMGGGGGQVAGDVVHGRYLCLRPNGCGLTLSPATGYDELVQKAARRIVEEEARSLHTSVTPVDPKAAEKRAKILAQLAAIDTKFTDGELELERWETMTATLKAKLPVVEEITLAMPALDEYDAAMKGTFADKKFALSRAVDRIVVLPGSVGLKGVRPERLHIRGRG